MRGLWGRYHVRSLTEAGQIGRDKELEFYSRRNGKSTKRFEKGGD